MASATSKTRAIEIDATDKRGKTTKEKIFIATRVTEDGDGTYTTYLIQLEDETQDANLGKIIGTRNKDNPNKWDWNDNASKDIKRNEKEISKKSKEQVNNSQDILNLADTAEERSQLQFANANNNTAEEISPESFDTASQVETDKGQKDAGDIRFPGDIGSQGSDIIKFDMLEYAPKKLGNEQSKREDRTPIRTCFLPIPGGIGDGNASNWSEGSLNPLEMAMGATALNTIEKGYSGTEESFREEIKNAKLSAELKPALAAQFAGMAIGKGGELLSRAKGLIINPNMELLFQGPSLRSFLFTYNLFPRSSDESKQAANVIRFFKQGSAPIRTEGNLFLRTPNTFKITYFHKNTEEHKYLNLIKECACLNVSVNYTPNGNYATYHDGGMIGYTLNLTFQELEPIFNDDYADTKSLIGY